MPTYRVPADAPIEVLHEGDWQPGRAAVVMRFQSGKVHGDYLHFERDGFTLRVRKGLVEKVNRLPINRPRFKSRKF